MISLSFFHHFAELTKHIHLPIRVVLHLLSSLSLDVLQVLIRCRKIKETPTLGVRH